MKWPWIVTEAMAALAAAAPSSRSGHLIYVYRATMFAVPFDSSSQETRGAPMPVLDDVAFQSSTGASQLDFSPTPAGHGILFYRRAAGGTAAGQRVLVATPAESARVPDRDHEGVFLENFLDYLRHRAPAA